MNKLIAINKSCKLDNLVPDNIVIQLIVEKKTELKEKKSHSLLDWLTLFKELKVFL